MDDLDALDVAMPIPGCWDGIDNDGDFLIDIADPDCTFVLDPLEAPDSDGDAISNALDSDDDGDGVLSLGSAECSLVGWAGTTAAPCCLGPGLGTCATDNCAWTANPAQTDSGYRHPCRQDRDACQCGDTNSGSTVTATDMTGEPGHRRTEPLLLGRFWSRGRWPRTCQVQRRRCEPRRRWLHLE
jgi:hypothetical protein